MVTIVWNKSPYKASLEGKVKVEGSMGMTQEITPRYLRVPQAASYLGLAAKTLYRYAEERLIPVIRKGRTIFFDRMDLDRWMQEGRITPLSVWNN